MSKLVAEIIEWDIDEDKYEDVELSKTIEIPEGMTDKDEISEYLSEQTGYCHNGFSIARV